MKKKLCAVLLALMMTAALAAAEEAAPIRLAGDRFEGFWLADGVLAEIYPVSGGFCAAVRTGDRLWRYWCLYHKDTSLLADTGFGTLNAVTLREDGGMTVGETLYDDGACTFAIDGDGCLIWNDEKDNAGEGLAFTRRNRFAGQWAAENVTVTITFTGEDYRVLVVQDSESSPSWQYVCTYDPEDGSLRGAGRQMRTTADEDGDATLTETVQENIACAFTLSPAGELSWQDASDSAGEWLVFTRRTDAFGFPL